MKVDKCRIFVWKPLRKQTLRSPIKEKEENTQVELIKVTSNDGVTCNWLGIVSTAGPGICGGEPSGSVAWELVT
jgi:hypothetical protein